MADDPVATAAPCPQGRTDYEACFAPFRYCPVKGCGRAATPDYGDAFAEAVAASARLGAALAQFDAALKRLGAATTARREAGIPDGT